MAHLLLIPSFNRMADQWRQPTPLRNTPSIFAIWLSHLFCGLFFPDKMLYLYKKGMLLSHSNSISRDSFPANLTINVCFPDFKGLCQRHRPSVGLYFCLSELKRNAFRSTVCFHSAPGSRKATPSNTSTFLVYSCPSSMIISFLSISGRYSFLPSWFVYSTRNDGVSIAVARIGYTFKSLSFFSGDSANAIAATRARLITGDIVFIILLIITERPGWGKGLSGSPPLCSMSVSIHRNDICVCKPISFNSFSNSDWNRVPKHGTVHNDSVDFAILPAWVAALRKLRNQVSWPFPSGKMAW